MLATRLISLLPLLFLVSLLTFSLTALLPQEPAALKVGDNATPEALHEARKELGTDRPWVVQYGDWAGNAVTGDLGHSYFSSVPVTRQIGDRIGITLSLTAVALLISIIVGVGAGILAAVYRGSPIDRVATVGASIGTATPAFWLAMFLASQFAVRWHIFDATGYVRPSESISGWLKSLVMPATALGLAGAATLARQTRSAMIGVLGREYVRTALASGLPRRKVITRYALKNALGPVLTVLGFQVTFLIGSSFVVEKVFGIEGLGSLAVNAVLRHDAPVIQGLVIVIAIVVVVVNLLLDMLYGWVNPKVRAS
ncbi:MAG: ABC transporter permease [Ilumatobacteraceae bacterium]